MEAAIATATLLITVTFLVVGWWIDLLRADVRSLTWRISRLELEIGELRNDKKDKRGAP